MQTYSQRGAASTMAVAALLLRGAAGHEGPLDGSLGGLCEGKGPCDLEHTCRRNQHTQSHVCVIFYQSQSASLTAQKFSSRFS